MNTEEKAENTHRSVVAELSNGFKRDGFFELKEIRGDFLSQNQTVGKEEEISNLKKKGTA
jgi:hypothetical protein